MKWDDLNESVFVTITDEAEQAIRSAAIGEFDPNSAKQLPNGDWRVRLTPDTLQRLGKFALKGESVSDTIIRAIRTQKGTN